MQSSIHRVVTPLLSLLAAAAAACAVVPAAAQQYPSKPITVVVPTAPGGPLDTLIRMYEPRVTPLLGQPLVIENKPGAGTYLGGESVARSAPDGYTLLINATGGVFPDVFQKGLAVRLSEQLVPVALLGDASYFAFGPGDFPAKDLREFIALARANPGKYGWGLIPNAVLTLQSASFLKSQNVQVLQVPFNSAANIATALLRNDVQLYIGSISAIKPQIDAGKIKVFATIGDRRSPAAAETLTTKEQGMAFDMNGDYVLFVPLQTPAGVSEVINARFRQAAETAEVKAGLVKLGFNYSYESPAVMAKKFSQLKGDVPRMAKDAGVVPQ
jgi:tripartite-type tricarboxylate transporter receptor subunit TctC